MGPGQDAQGMPINLAIRTSSVVADLVQNKELEGIFSGTITRHTCSAFLAAHAFLSCILTTKVFSTMDMDT